MDASFILPSLIHYNLVEENRKFFLKFFFFFFFFFAWDPAQKIEIKKLENNRNEKDAFSRLDKNGIKQKTKKRHYDDDLRGHLIKKIKKTKRKL